MILLKPNFYQASFSETIKEFPRMFKALTSCKKYLIADYFTSHGIKGICKQIGNSLIVSEKEA